MTRLKNAVWARCGSVPFASRALDRAACSAFSLQARLVPFARISQIQYEHRRSKTRKLVCRALGKFDKRGQR